MASEGKASNDANKTAVSYILDWGKSSLPPTILATLITALYARPFSPMPMLLPPVLLLSSYTNLNSHVVGSAGITAGASGLYILMARRRARKSLKSLGARRVVNGAAVAIAAVNLLAGGITYTFENRDPTRAT